MTIRGGGNPHPAMAAMPLREWTRRLRALPAVTSGVNFTQNQQFEFPYDVVSALQPIRSRMPPCSGQSRPSPSGGREDAASLDRPCARRLRDLAVGMEECSRRGSNQRMDPRSEGLMFAEQVELPRVVVTFGCDRLVVTAYLGEVGCLELQGEFHQRVRNVSGGFIGGGVFGRLG